MLMINILLLLTSIDKTNAQGPDDEVVFDPTSYTFHLEGQDEDGSTVTLDPDHVVWFFGDGHYSNEAQPEHDFVNSGDTDVSAYYMGRYIPLPPSFADNVFNTAVVSSPGYTNPTYYSDGSGLRIDVSSAWDPVSNMDIIYTMVITNDASEMFDGFVRFCYPEDILDQDVHVLPNSLNNSSWFNYLGTSSDCNDGNTNVDLNVNEIPPSEQRVVHLKFNVQSVPLRTPVFTKALLFDKRGDEVASNNSQARVSGSPYDPNFKIDSTKVICDQSKAAQEVDYEIHFQNSGDGYATKININDYYSNMNMLTDVEVNESTFPPTDVDMNAQGISFVFSGVSLPGSQQTDPYIYSYEQTRGFIKYTVFTRPCLYTFNEQTLTSYAEIQFNQNDPIVTNSTTHDLDEVCDDNEPLCDEGTTKKIVSHGDIMNRNAYNTASLQAQPNPFYNTFSISLDGAFLVGETTISIYDAQGRLFKNITANNLADKNGRIDFNSSDWNQGLYLIRAQNGKHLQTVRCIKQN